MKNLQNAVKMAVAGLLFSFGMSAAMANPTPYDKDYTPIQSGLITPVDAPQIVLFDCDGSGVATAEPCA